MTNTRLHLLWRERGLSRRFRTAVSLHSHTMHSRESLSVIPMYARHLPLLAWELDRLARRYRKLHGRPLDYSRGYWTPPLPERAAYQLERRGIEEKLGLAAIVSLTDHDTIEAGLRLRQSPETAAVPISLEWTVPVDGTYFHIGVHNLPPGSARAIAAEAAACTRAPDPDRRREILAEVSRHPDTLVVLNHPLWDQSGCGAERHRAALRELLEGDRGIHALEVNGPRPWAENLEVMEWARGLGCPVVAGGDRHACEPSSILNLTNAASFGEFAAEVRASHSVVGFQEHYREPRGFRIIKAISDIMGEYPELHGRVRWSDRVYCRRYCGTTIPLSGLWNGDVPLLVRAFDRLLRVVRNGALRRAVGLCLREGAEWGFGDYCLAAGSSFTGSQSPRPHMFLQRGKICPASKRAGSLQTLHQ